MKKKKADNTCMTICFDFDGVIHSYVSGWHGTDVIPDRMVTGIGKLIRKLKADGYRIVIFTTRAILDVGHEAVRKYLNRRHIPYDLISAEKPPAFCYIDD